MKKSKNHASPHYKNKCNDVISAKVCFTNPFYKTVNLSPLGLFNLLKQWI